MTDDELRQIANEVRKGVLTGVHAAKSGHPGGSLGAADIMTYLYFEEMNVNPADPRWADRDRFVLSKGHCAPGLYAVLAEKGFFAKEELATLRPGQQAVVDARSRRLLSVSEVQTGKYTAWHYNHKVYECISFSEIVGLIEERYDVSVIYDPSSFDDTAYRLVVGNNEPLGQMLDILNLIVPIEYTVQDRRVLIKRKR